MVLTERHIQGFKKEKELHPLIEETLGVKLNTTSRYHKFDFINKEKKVLVELKTRTITSTHYDKCCMNISKLPYAHEKMDEGYTVWFFFHFSDDVTYYLKYDRDNKYSGTGIKYLYIKLSDCTPITS